MSLVRLVYRVHKDHQESRDFRVQQVYLEYLVRLDDRGPLENLESEDLLDQR